MTSASSAFDCPDLRQKNSPLARRVLKVAGRQGFEPRQTVPKTVVLPLHHRPNEVRDSRKQNRLVKHSVEENLA